MTSRRAFMLGLVGVGLAGCGGSDEGDGTPNILYGKENCVRCGMLIAEKRHSAAIVEPGGTELHFDDTGEMVAAIQETGLDERTIWVHEYDTKEWLLAEQALFVIDPERRTPMATGVIAFGSKENAAAFTGDPTSAVFSWSELLAGWSIQ